MSCIQWGLTEKLKTRCVILTRRYGGSKTYILAGTVLSQRAQPATRRSQALRSHFVLATGFSVNGGKRCLAVRGAVHSSARILRVCKGIDRRPKSRRASEAIARRQSREGLAGNGRILEAIKPEAVYFTEQNGQRGAVLIVDLPDPSKIPALAEPWFLTFEADVEFRVVMNPDDLKRAGLDELGKQWS
jgi:hypothetical protein